MYVVLVVSSMYDLIIMDFMQHIEQGDNDTICIAVFCRSKMKQPRHSIFKKNSRCLLTMSTMPADTFFSLPIHKATKMIVHAHILLVIFVVEFKVDSEHCCCKYYMRSDAMMTVCHNYYLSIDVNVLLLNAFLCTFFYSLQTRVICVVLTYAIIKYIVYAMSKMFMTM